MGDQLSWQQSDEACCNDHTEGDPLDGVEDAVRRVDVRVGLAEEGEEELDDRCRCEGEGEGVTGMPTAAKLAEQGESQKSRCDGGVNGNGMEAGVIGWYMRGPREGGGQAGVAAFREVSQREEGPDDGGAGAPGVEGVEDGEATYAEVDHGCEDGEKDAAGGEGGHHQQEEGVGEEVAEVREDEKQAGEREG